MALPPAGILDNFNRPDQASPPSSQWATAAGYVGFALSGNSAAPEGPPGAISFWQTLLPADQEAFVKVSVLAQQDLEDVGLLVRNTRANRYSVTDNASYEVQFWRSSVGNDQAYLYRNVDGVSTQLGATVDLGGELAVGDVIGLRVTGTTLELYRNNILVASRSDATVYGAGYIGMRAQGTTARLDDFGGSDPPPVSRRFQPIIGVPSYAGEPGHNRDDNRDGNRQRQPTSTHGDMVTSSTFRDLATGEEWYYDGEGWKRAMTGMGRVAAEWDQTCRVLAVGNRCLTELLTHMRNACARIAGKR